MNKILKNKILLIIQIIVLLFSLGKTVENLFKFKIRKK